MASKKTFTTGNVQINCGVTTYFKNLFKNISGFLPPNHEAAASDKTFFLLGLLVYTHCCCQSIIDEQKEKDYSNRVCVLV